MYIPELYAPKKYQLKMDRIEGEIDDWAMIGETLILHF